KSIRRSPFASLSSAPSSPSAVRGSGLQRAAAWGRAGVVGATQTGGTAMLGRHKRENTGGDETGRGDKEAEVEREKEREKRKEKEREREKGKERDKEKKDRGRERERDAEKGGGLSDSVGAGVASGLNASGHGFRLGLT